MAMSFARDPVAQFPDGQERLYVMEAVEDGWRAFSRAPWPFTLFGLLTVGPNLLLQAVLNGVSWPDAQSLPNSLAVAILASGGAAIAAQLWGTTGMIRAGWVALEGNRPDWGTFLRWDGRGIARLLLAQLSLSALMFSLLIGTVLLLRGSEFFPGALAPIARFAILLGGGLLGLYLLVGQTFLPWVALLQGPGPLASIAQGQRVVGRSQGQVLRFVIVTFLLWVTGLALCLVGLFVAQPVIICVATAAYRQLFGHEDRAGALAVPPSHS
jgi:hypothetical protein